MTGRGTGGGPVELDERQALERAAVLAGRGGRPVLAVVGPPGCGKSTVADEVVEHVGDGAVVVGMDGFHLADEELDRQGLRDVKGSPPTFDVAGLVALLRRLRDEPGPVYAPRFEREREDPLAGAVAVRPEHALVVLEGNYLLLDRPGWADVRPLLDETWYLDVDDEVRRRRLVRRHVHHGRDEAAARAWEERVDQPNAVLVAATRERADVVVRGG